MGYTTIHRKKNKVFNVSLPNRKQTETSVIYNKPQFLVMNKLIVKRKGMTHDVAEILSNGQWKDKRCFIIGGGPSLINIDAKKLENELTIGVNKAFIKYNPTVNYAMDMKFYDYITYGGEGEEERLKINEQWKKYQGIKVFLQPTGSVKNKFQFVENVYLIKRIHEKKVSFDLVEGIYGSSNSGLGAVMLACCLGVNTIGLLGFDMKVDKKMNKTHWHVGYQKQNIDTFARRLESYKQTFYEFAPVWRQLNIQIINVNKEENTALKCFDIKGLGEVI